MRIGLFTDAYIPQISGVASSTALLKQALQAMGHVVFVITPSDPNQPVDENDVFRVPSLPFVSAKRFTIAAHPILDKQLQELGLDIVHSQTEFGMGIFARKVAQRLGVPQVHTFHTLYEDWLNDQVRAKEGGLYRRFTHWFVKNKSRRFCNEADSVIVPTQKTWEILQKYGVTTPIHIIPTGIDIAAFQGARNDTASAAKIREQLKVKATDKLLLYLGRVSQEKQIDHLLTYLKTALADRSDVHFVVVGDGPAKDDLSKMAAKSAMTKRIHFTGPVPFSEVHAYYAAADFFLSASQSETQGLTYIEALAAGVPILVRRDPALDGVIQNGINGYDFEDESSFKAHLNTLLNLEAKQYKALCTAAYDSASPYGVDVFAKRIFDVYASLISEEPKTIILSQEEQPFA